MSLIAGIGDEVTHFFIALFVIIIVYFAWWSTNIYEQRHYRTVLLLDRRRRTTRSILRVRIPRRLSNHTEAVTISEGSSATNTSSTQIEEQSESSDVSNNLPHPPQILPKPNEVATTSSNSETTERSDLEASIDNLSNCEELEEREIIETMDADTQNAVRLRRIAHFEGATTSKDETVENDSEQSDNGQLAHSSTTPTSNNVENKDNNEEGTRAFLNDKSNVESNVSEVDPANITIKLKYINDDIRVVDGRLEEFLGDFKSRHFQSELNSNKIVRLIFNGQVLKQDRQTLQNCGLFNNCVVHCLIHQKRPSIGEGQQSQDGTNQSSEFFRDHRYAGVTNNNNQGIDWDLGNFLFALISFILLAAWYFRYVYAHLYTVTATVGLLIITGIFSIVLIGTYFPDNDQILNHNIRIRPARTERAE